jgi:hypothetical protein
MRQRNRLKQFRKTMAELSAIQAQQGSVPESVVKWAIEYFGDMPEVQSTIGKDAGNREAGMQGVMEHIQRRGIIARLPKVVDGGS